eukprot:3556563-Pleurochrysis_carterae.AAC.2
MPLNPTCLHVVNKHTLTRFGALGWDLPLPTEKGMAAPPPVSMTSLCEHLQLPSGSASRRCTRAQAVRARGRLLGLPLANVKLSPFYDDCWAHRGRCQGGRMPRPSLLCRHCLRITRSFYAALGSCKFCCWPP